MLEINIDQIGVVDIHFADRLVEFVSVEGQFCLNLDQIVPLWPVGCFHTR